MINYYSPEAYSKINGSIAAGYNKNTYGIDYMAAKTEARASARAEIRNIVFQQ